MFLFIYIYICMYIYINIYIYIYIYMYIYIYIYKRFCLCTYRIFFFNILVFYIFTNIYLFVHVHVCPHVFIFSECLCYLSKCMHSNCNWNNLGIMLYDGLSSDEGEEYNTSSASLLTLFFSMDECLFLGENRP